MIGGRGRAALLGQSQMNKHKASDQEKCSWRPPLFVDMWRSRIAVSGYSQRAVVTAQSLKPERLRIISADV